MIQGPTGLRLHAPAPPEGGGIFRLAFSPDAFPDAKPSASLTASFPQVRFEPLPGPWTGAFGSADIVIATVDAGDPARLSDACAHLVACGRPDRVIFFVANADLDATRQLVRAGAAEVLPAPIGEVILAGGLERLIAKLQSAGLAGRPPGGRVVSVLKAGGGVGATAIATQTCAILSERGQRVCLVDLDLQFGGAAGYLDVEDAISLDQVIVAGEAFGETPFRSALGVHSSGVRLLAAPPDLMPLDRIRPSVISGLIDALKREFDLIVLDLPTVWTDWTHRAVELSDEILLVTQVSVPHAHVAKRQQRALAMQGLDVKPLTLVCNRVGRDQAPGVSVKSMERALGCAVEVQIPDDARVMGEAINQGVMLKAIRRGTKLEKALSDLADRLAPVATEKGRGLWRR
jgi:pilus assembly protein CpaE